MNRSRISTLFFVIFLMIITPLTPMTSAVNARSVIMSGSISWYNGPGSVTVDDQSDNYMINVSGTYVRSEFDYHYDYSLDLMELNVLPKASFQDYNKGNSLAWMDVPSWTNVTDYWSIILHDISAYNSEISQNGNTSNNSGFNSDNFCLFQESFPAATFPFSNQYNYASNAFSHWCAPANLTVNSYTYPVIEIDVDGTAPGTIYDIFYDIIDCNTNNVILTRLVEFTGQSGPLTLDSNFANLTSSSGNYKLYAQIQDQQSALDSFTTSCTGTQGGNSGGNGPVPQLSNIEVVEDDMTGLSIGEVSITNLTPSTEYDYYHGLYSFAPNPFTGGSTCSYDLGYSAIHHFNSTTITGSNFMPSMNLNLEYELGGNFSGSDPYELHAGTNYCYVFKFKESSAEDWQFDLSEAFSATPSFSGCTLNQGLSQFCWNHNEYAAGGSFSSDGKWITYSETGMGDAISNIGLPPGQWYWEIDVLRNSGTDNFALIGVNTGEPNTLNLASGLGGEAPGLGFNEFGWSFDPASFVYHNNEYVQLGCSSGGCWTSYESYTIGVALDSVTGSMWYSVNGNWLDNNFGNSNLFPRSYSQQIFGQETGPDGTSNLSLWETNHGNSGLSGLTLYPAVSDSSTQNGMSFSLVSSSHNFQIPDGFHLIEDYILDSDGDGVLNYLEVDGCTDVSAINYDTNATDDDGSCTYTEYDDEPVWDCDGDGEFEESSQFQYSQSLSAEMTQESGPPWLSDGDLLAAFVGDELRGVARTSDVPAAFGGGKAFMLMIYSNQEGELVEFRFFDKETGFVYSIHDTLIFEADDNNGSLINLTELNFDGEVYEFTTCGDPTDDDGDTNPKDILILSDNNNNIPDKFDETYQIIKTAFSLYGSGYSREIQVGGDYYSYWNEDNNYLIAWDSVNGYWMVYHLNNLGDSFYDTEEVINALDDSDYDNLDGKRFSWLQSDDYSSISVTGSQNYPETNYKIPLEEDSVVYGNVNDGGLEGWCMDPIDNYEESQYDSKEDCENAGFSWILYLEPELYWGNGDDNPHVLSIDVDFDGTAPFPGLHEIEINFGIYEANPYFDSDGDVMPDFWEVNYGLDPYSPTDANADPDGDGLSNLEEFGQGTNPMSADTDQDGLTDNYDTENGVNLSYPQLLYQMTIQNNLDLEEIYGFIETISNLQQFPDGLRYYCVDIIIIEQASGNLKANTWDCFELDVNDAYSDGGNNNNNNNPLNIDVVWNSDQSRIEVYTHVNYQNVFSDIHLDFVIDSYETNYDFNYEYNYGLLIFDEYNQAILGGPVIINPEEIGMQYDRNYCIKFILEANPGQPDEQIIDRRTRCFSLISNSSFDTSLVDRFSDLTSGYTSVTSNLPGLDGSKAIDDDLETRWVSANNCTDSGNSESIVLGLDINGLLATGISIKFDQDNTPEIFEISKKVDGNWEFLIQNFEMDDSLNDFMRMGFIFEPEIIEEIKISCKGNQGQFGIIEVSVHHIHLDLDGDGIFDYMDNCPTIPGNSPNGCIDDDNGNNTNNNLYIFDDLTENSLVFTSSNYNGNDGENTIDNDYSTFWESDGACPQDIVIDFGMHRVGLIHIFFNQEIVNSQLIDIEINFWDSLNNNWYTNQNSQLFLDKDYFSLHVYPQMTERVMIKCNNFDANIKIDEIEIFEATLNWDNLDIDSDGIMNAYDHCFAGIQFISDNMSDYDGDGCLDFNEDGDDDNDGINDEEDLCPLGELNWNTWDDGTDYDHDGCLDDTEDNDDDNDGIFDFSDNCSETRLGANVDSLGCETSFDDEDLDGVSDSYDQCPNTEIGVEVDPYNGCPWVNHKHIELSTNFDNRSIEFGGELVEIEANQGWPSVLVTVDNLQIGTQYQINAKVWDYSTFPEEEMFCNNWPSQIVTGPCENSYSFTAQQEEMTMTLHYPALESSTQACLVVKLFDNDFEEDNKMICWNQDSKSDWDLDGVIDINDLCGATSINSSVDETGCLIIESGNNSGLDDLLDTDGDGVTDLDADGNTLDQCPDTEEGVEVDEVGCSTSVLLPPALASALDFVLNIDSLLGLPDGTLEIIFAAMGMLFGVIRFVGRRTLAGKSRRVEKYAKEIRLSRTRRELENLERRITKDNEKKLLPPGGFGDLMELIETRALELGETDLAKQFHNNAEEYGMSQEQMLEEMEGTRKAVEGLQEELSEMRRKGPPGKGRGRKGPPRRRSGGNNSGYQMQQSGGPRRPSLHPADLDGDGFVTEEEKRLYRQKQEQEDGLWEYD